MFGLVSLFNGISTFRNYLVPKLSLLKNSSDTIWPIKVSKVGELSREWAEGSFFNSYQTEV